MTYRHATCSCGQLQAHVQGEPIRVTVCHCLTCQRRTGSVFGVQARFERSAVEIDGRFQEWVRIGNEGTHITFRFCPECGATVFYTMAGHEGIIGIPVGAFADPAFPAPSVSIYEERMPPWVQMPIEIEHLP
ncbi:hypothetical protein HNQ59_000605 [Chitinivorax tropicus]|uniref:CENP-V/GFA domain-containing protein n=1 Tax=Chitinivorax tropicus TaxID=714531 RepID=A0A840MQ18_9PROT|nr:GFA family protein [Chitinivorax tropicus]MBB5017341.1 hypothetical protein [Chitinivorax tropicus]